MCRGHDGTHSWAQVRGASPWLLLPQLATRGCVAGGMPCSDFPQDPSVRNRVVIDMEDLRCKIVAMKTEDLRCGSLLSGVAIEMEDPRCKSLLNRVVIEMDEPRCRNVAIDIEDPRCNNLLMTWR